MPRQNPALAVGSLAAGGKPVKVRTTMFDVAKDGCSFKQEMAMGGGPFAVIGEGKAKKVG